MPLRTARFPISCPQITHVRTIATAHRRAAAKGRPPLLKNMPKRAKRPEVRQKKEYWKLWLAKNAAPRDMTTGQLDVLERLRNETSHGAAAARNAIDGEVDALATDVSARLEVSPVRHNASSGRRQPSTSRSPLPYGVSRTATGNLPTYQLAKAGGSLLQTRIRRVGGLGSQLKEELASWLQPTPLWLRVNSLNGHIEIKGWYKKQVDTYLIARGF